MRIDLHDGFHLSPVRDGDQAAYMEHFNDKDTSDRLLKIPYPYTKEHADFWVGFRVEAAKTESHPSHFGLRRTDQFLIGGIGLFLNKGVYAHRAELGYWISKDYRNRGLMTATIRAVTTYGFQTLNLKRIEAIPFSHNPASHRVLEKAGYAREGFMPAYYLKEGVLIDAYMFATVHSAAASPV